VSVTRKIKIDKEKCIGCGLCASINSISFEMVNDKAQVKKNVEKTDEIKEVITSCPNGAITFS
jgi:ferredoxin